MTDENEAVARRVYELIATGNDARVEDVIDPEADDNERPSCHDLPKPKLIDTFRQFATEGHTAFPDTRIEVEDMISEGDKVTARVTMSGTHQGEFQGIAPTGNRVQVRAIDIFRIMNGKIVEHWGHGDDPTDILREPKRPSRPDRG